MKRWIRSLWVALAIVAAPAAAQTVFFGSLHSHTSYSDGSGTPEDAFKAARAAGLDFFAVTEHNHAAAEAGAKERADGRLIATDPRLYAGQPTSLVETANRLTVPGRFVAIYGQEFSTISSGNHMNVFEIPAVIAVANGAYDQLVQWANRTPDSGGQRPLMQMNHPNDPRRAARDYGRDDFGGDSNWVAALDPYVELIEILSGPALTDGTGLRPRRHESQFLRYLDLGFHIAPTAGQDNHYRNWGTSNHGRTAVLAERLTRQDILAAMRDRHVYATEDRNLRIVFRANGTLLGGIASRPAEGSPLQLDISIRDDDEPNAAYLVELLRDTPGDGQVATVAASTRIRGNTGAVALPAVTLGRGGGYVLLRITQTNAGGGADRAWTAPVWFE